MKKIIVILFSVSFFTACKKDKTANTNCNRVQKLSTISTADGQRDFIFEYNRDGTIKSEIKKVLSNGFVDTAAYTYANNGKKITAISAYFKTVYYLNDDGYIINREENLTPNLIVKTHFTYDGNGFLATRTQENFLNGQTTPNQKYFISYTNTVENGNLVKTITINKDVTANKTDPPVTVTREYDLSKPAFSNIPTPYSGSFDFYIGIGNFKSSKNRMAKYYDGSKKYSFDNYQTDNNGRLSEVVYTDISGSGVSNNGKYLYTYQCN